MRLSIGTKPRRASAMVPQGGRGQKGGFCGHVEGMVGAPGGQQGGPVAI